MDICPICGKSVSDKCNSIQCDICDLWTHQFRCSGLSLKQFNALSQSDSDNWYCPVCVNNALPGSDVFETSIQTTSIPSSSLSDELKLLLSDFNDIVTGTTTSDEDDEDIIQFHNNSCSYVDCNQLNNMISKTQIGCSAFHLNIASMPKHFDKLINLLASINCSFSFIGISETRSLVEEDDELPEPPESAQLEQKEDFPIPGYKKFFTPTESSAGGVSLYILKSLSCKPRDDLSKTCYQSLNLESVFVEIFLANRPNIIVGNIYRHPCMTTKSFNSDFLQPLLHKIKSERKHVILLGDFNIDLLKCEESNDSSTFLDILGSNLILPQILLPTRVTDHSKTLIDNIFSSPTESGTISGNICHSISDHLPQFFIFPSLDLDKILDDGPYYRKDWTKFKEVDFILDFLGINWTALFESLNLDPNLCFDAFNNKIKGLMERHIPTVKLTKDQVKCKLKPWITPGIVKSIDRRDFYHRKYIRCKNKDEKARLFVVYKRYRNSIVSLSRRSKYLHFTRFFNRHSNNMKKVWSGVRDIISSRTGKSTTPISISVGDSVTSDPSKVANSFNDFFTSIADSIRDKIQPANHHFSNFMKNPNQRSLFFSPSTPEEIGKIINSFSPSKSNGPNSIPVKLLKLLNQDFSTQISFLINRSLETGVFPSSLKISKVVPVFKNKGSPLDVSNYRPISLLSNIEKIYEKVAYSRVMSFLNRFNQIYSKQFGFRKAHSTIDTLINITERIRERLDEREFACGVFVDLQKAFDTVDHEILLSKLDHYGIRGTENAWFRSYLSGRSQFVQISNSQSASKPVKHGVPQGSVLGPLLFLIYINDLHKCIRTSETYHFADDTHLLNFAETVWSLCGRVNADLRVLVSWLKANKISLNASKTEFVIFRSPWKRLDSIPRLKLSGQILTPSKWVKYLGVYLDEHLNWKQHVSTIATKLRRANGAISKIRHYVPTKTLLSVYHAIFASHFRYAAQTWALCDNTVTHRIQTLQNTAIRLITFNGPRVSANPLLADLKLLNVFDHVKVMNIAYLHRYFNANLPADSLNTLTFDKVQHVTETKDKVIELIFRPNVNTTNFGLNSFTRISSNQWNELQRNFADKKLSEIELKELKTISSEYFLNQYSI